MFDVEASQVLDAGQKARVLERAGPRITAVAQEARSQARNREVALERLRERIARALAVPRPRHATRPTRASKERRLEQKRQLGQRKRDRRRRFED